MWFNSFCLIHKISYVTAHKDVSRTAKNLLLLRQEWQEKLKKEQLKVTLIRGEAGSVRPTWTHGTFPATELYFCYFCARTKMQRGSQSEAEAGGEWTRVPVFWSMRSFFLLLWCSARVSACMCVCMCACVHAVWGSPRKRLRLLVILTPLSIFTWPSICLHISHIKHISCFSQIQSCKFVSMRGYAQL